MYWNSQEATAPYAQEYGLEMRTRPAAIHVDFGVVYRIHVFDQLWAKYDPR